MFDKRIAVRYDRALHRNNTYIATRRAMFNRNRLVPKRDINKLDAAQRVELEAKITDARAAKIDLERYRDISLERYQHMSACHRYLFDFLGDVRGKRVLDVCCGYAMTPVMFALAGAEVVANDVAPLTLEQVRRVAVMHGVEDKIEFHCGPAEQMPYPDTSFDIIYGGAAIHHLLIDAAGREFARLLRPGGRGAFKDPLGHNPLLEFVRDNVNYSNKHPAKGTDHPLKVADIATFGSHFATYSWRGFDFLMMGTRVAPKLWKFKRALEVFDTTLFDTVRPLQRYARFAVTCVTN